LLQGDELHALLERELRFLPERAVALLLPLIDGLATAHDKGIVHRDIKPENIFIARDDQGRLQPKMLDFGIAKLTAGAPVSRLTESGAIVGSPQYFSPQQAEGLDDVDFRTDIWSMGVLLYELVTGVPPFEAANYNALIYSISQKEPVPITGHGVGDDQLWGIVSRCLQKNPADRWGSMWELGEALALWLFERGVRVDAASRSLKDGWLEGAVTGVQVLVESEPAPASYGRSEAVTPPPVRRKVPNAGLVTTIKRAPASRASLVRKHAPVAVLALAILAAAVFVGLQRRNRDGGSASSPSAEPTRRLAAAGVPSAPPSVAASVAEGTTPNAPLATPDSSARSDAKRSSAQPSASPSGMGTSARAKADAPKRRPPPMASKTPPTRSGVDKEFGF
jgi:hypothetical protein